MKGPLECCGVDNLYLSPDGKKMQCRLCGTYHRAPLQGYPSLTQIKNTIWELISEDKKVLAHLQVLFNCYDKEKTPAEELDRGYYNMWVWLQNGPTWEQKPKQAKSEVDQAQKPEES